ncbi:MAG: cbb3-type cytochrome c oxidase subunit II [Thermaerobacter sp.]|jgi:cytochrome c oxidase cbb3-type subunit 2|nr:cbb3-type cytochrome c oxidase subunit II [Thermaerobacter sp.]
MRYMWGMLMVVFIFATAIVVTVVLPDAQMLSQVKPTPQAAKLAKLYRPESGWTIADPLNTGANAPSMVGRGRVVFLREGCYFCHTMMVEQTMDYTDYGKPEPAGWWWAQRPTVNANERTGPDLQHVGTRLPSKMYMIQHERYPRLAVEPDGVTTHAPSVMPDFYWLSNTDLNALADFLRAQK